MNSRQRRTKNRAKYFWHVSRIANPIYACPGSVAWTPHYTFDHDHDIDFYCLDKKTKKVLLVILSTVMLEYVIKVDEQVLNDETSAEFADNINCKGLYVDRTKTLMDSGEVKVREQVRKVWENKGITCYVATVAVNHFSANDVKTVAEWILNRDVIEYQGDIDYSFTHDQILSRVTDDDLFGYTYSAIDIQNQSVILGR